MAKKIFISRGCEDEARQIIPRDWEVDLHAGTDGLPRAEFLARLKGKDGLICQITDVIDDEVLASAPTLKVVCNIAVGYNNVDVEAARRRGDRKSTRLNSSHIQKSRMPSSA